MRALRPVGAVVATTIGCFGALPWTLPCAGFAAPAPAATATEAAGSTAAPATQGFGRWESALQSCQLVWSSGSQGPQQRSGCLSLRLDQTIEGMVRVRLINAAAGSRYASEELVFAGLLLRNAQPMRCQQGHCTPSWPMRIYIRGVATRHFDARGLASQLPSTELAQGSCYLEATALRCQAQSSNGQRWQAQARLSHAEPGGRKPGDDARRSGS